MTDNKFSEIVSTSLENIRAIADSNTVIGDPVETNNGTVIIPVSKISLGFASGGAEYDGKDKKKKEQEKSQEQTKPHMGKLSNFAGGSGTGISVVPVCFLVVSKDGAVEVLNVDSPVTVSPVVGAIDSVSSFLEGTPDLVSRLKDVFKKNKNNENVDPESVKEEIDGLE